MTTDTANTTAASTGDTPPAAVWLVGDYYDQTVDLTLDQVADRVHQDLYDVRYDHMLPAPAEFDVTADTSGPVPVLRVIITGLVGTDNPCEGVTDGDAATVYDAIRRVYGDGAVVYEVMRQAFELTNHYNRVHLTRPERSRFIQHITALRPDGAPAIVLVGMMHDAVTPERPASTTGTATTDPGPTSAATPARQPHPVA